VGRGDHPSGQPPAATASVPVVGRRRWAIADGYIPPSSHGAAPQLVSHDAVCILNAGDRDADVIIAVYVADREPAGPDRVVVPARRKLHQRFTDLEPPVPADTDDASVIESDVPIVVQHTRLDSRQAETALLTTVAHAE
jgi:hypothetical protein